jgi:ABC-type transport system involved in cytochrome bd biosynthesis fused ATPase/permease subunit
LFSVLFDDVHFAYGAETLLSGFNLQVDEGDCIAISGVSGKGKTTIAHLLLGFMTPDKGHILFNYADTDAPVRRQYWPRIAYVQQRPFLINDTILKNITLEENASDKVRLRKAVKAAGLTGKGNNALGLQRLIRENGKKLSGGQRQRIAFARALYKDFDLLILDEPFSELDASSEKQMLEFLQHLSKTGKIILLITHHPANYFYCNKIVSLDGV